jgi:hypothetical protein
VAVVKYMMPQIAILLKKKKNVAMGQILIAAKKLGQMIR